MMMMQDAEACHRHAFINFVDVLSIPDIHRKIKEIQTLYFENDHPKYRAYIFYWTIDDKIFINWRHESSGLPAKITRNIMTGYGGNKILTHLLILTYLYLLILTYAFIFFRCL